MTKLEQLIEQLCPDGVSEYRIDEICDISRGRVISKDYINTNQGEYPVYSSQTENNGELGRINTYDYDGEYLTWTTDGANAGTVFYRTGKFSITNVCGLLKAKDNSILSKYLYYTLLQVAPSHVNKGMGNPKLMSNVMARIIVYVPPLEVQAEIVRVLDKYTEQLAELTTNLSAEQISRKKQYEHYRDKVFTFDNDIDYHSMGELFPFIRNGFVGTITPYFTDKEHGIRYLEGKNIHNGVISDIEELYVTKEFHEKHIRNKLKADDILMVQSGHVGECAVVGDKYAGANCHALIIMSNGGKINSKYVAYYFQTYEGKKKLDRITTGETVKHILASTIKKVTIPVPSIEDQRRIVAILDHFDKLCNDIAEGLPAEIEARKKQYEYYRDKLLTFKELNNE